jgi:hypothetical protein
MDLSHVKLGLGRGGWSRQQNLKVMPAAAEFAGVDMVSYSDSVTRAGETDGVQRLEAGAYRELHCERLYSSL